MPTNTSNALGTASQFMPRPRDVQAGGLSGVRSGGVSGSNYVSSATQLAGALGILGQTLADVEMSEQKRNEEYDLEVAKKAMAGETMESVATRGSLQILADKGLTTRDTGVGEALIDKQRGQMLSFAVTREFDNMVKDEPLPLTPEEYIAKYNEFVSAKYAHFTEKGVSNQTAFNEGFYEAHTSNQRTILSQYDTRKDKEDKEFALSTFNGSLGSAIENYNGTNKEGFTAQIINDYNQCKISGMFDTTTNITIAESAIKRLSASGIYTDKELKELASKMEVGLSPETLLPVTADKVIDINSYTTLTNATNANKLTIDTYNELEELKKLSVQDMIKAVSALEFTDRAKYARLAPHLTTLINEKKRAEEAEKARQAKIAINQQAKGMAISTVVSKITANLAGKAEWSDKVEVSYVDEDGVTKKRPATPEEIEQGVKVALAQYTQGKSPQDKNNIVLKVLGMPFASTYAQNYKNQGLYAINTMRVDDKGNLIGNTDVDNFYALYDTNPAEFARIFGTDLTGKLTVLSSMVLMTNDKDKAYREFARANVFLETNPKVKEAYTTEVSTKLAGASFDITGMDGNKISAMYSASPELLNTATTMGVYYRANHMDEYTLSNIQDMVSKSYTTYDGHNIIPKRIFSAQFPDVEDPIAVGKQVIDDIIINKYQGNYAEVSYNSATNEISIGYFPYPISQLRNQLMYMRKREEEQRAQQASVTTQQQQTVFTGYNTSQSGEYDAGTYNPTGMVNTSSGDEDSAGTYNPTGR